MHPPHEHRHVLMRRLVAPMSTYTPLQTPFWQCPTLDTLLPCAIFLLPFSLPRRERALDAIVIRRFHGKFQFPKRR